MKANLSPSDWVPNICVLMVPLSYKANTPFFFSLCPSLPPSHTHIQTDLIPGVSGFWVGVVCSWRALYRSFPAVWQDGHRRHLLWYVLLCVGFQFVLNYPSCTQLGLWSCFFSTSWRNFLIITLLTGLCFLTKPLYMGMHACMHTHTLTHTHTLSHLPPWSHAHSWSV